MPFVSKAQARFMYANHPDIAKRWEDMTGSIKNLPNHVNKAKSKAHAKAYKKGLRRLGLRNKKGLA
jgi:hypothetical protein